MTTSHVNSPPLGVGDREPPRNDDRAEVVNTRTEDVSINDLESVCSRMGLKLTQMVMHVLPVGETILQGESNRLRSHKARGCAYHESVEDLVSTEYIPSMGSLEVGLRRREELEHRHMEGMFISVRICPQEPEVDRIRMKRVARS